MSASSGGTGGVSLNFNPSITIPASAAGSPADIKAAIQQALRESGGSWPRSWPKRCAARAERSSDDLSARQYTVRN